ncbi:MAG: DUF99 family protein [archaeon]
MSHIGFVKAEIRLMGVDDGDQNRSVHFPVVGVVLRGGLWLDGVVAIELNPKSRHIADQLARMIMDSPFYKELRVIMLHGQFASSMSLRGLKRFHEIIKLPVMIFIDKRKKKRLGYISGKVSPFILASRQGFVILRAKITEDEMDAILRVSWKSGRLPEPLRVARLAARCLRLIKS